MTLSAPRVIRPPPKIVVHYIGPETAITDLEEEKLEGAPPLTKTPQNCRRRPRSAQPTRAKPEAQEISVKEKKVRVVFEAVVSLHVHVNEDLRGNP